MIENIARVSENSGGRGATWGDCMERQTYGNVGTCMCSYSMSPSSFTLSSPAFPLLSFSTSISPFLFLSSFYLPPTPSPFLQLPLPSLTYISNHLYIYQSSNRIVNCMMGCLTISLTHFSPVAVQSDQSGVFLD